MSTAEFDIVVIGGGAGGLVVAAGGAALGARGAVVEKHRLGGDCLWYGCVPSKTLLKSAKVAHLMRTAADYAIPAHAAAPRIADVMERVAGVIRCGPRPIVCRTRPMAPPLTSSPALIVAAFSNRSLYMIE